jgi:hypothetical protein
VPSQQPDGQLIIIITIIIIIIIIERMWNMKCFVMSELLGATGIVTQELKKYLEVTPGKH